jgi:hypothetical protein
LAGELITIASLSVVQLRGRRTLFNIVLDLRQEPFDYVCFGFVRQYLGL